jgi:hypothetical protein
MQPPRPYTLVERLWRIYGFDAVTRHLTQINKSNVNHLAHNEATLWS